MGLRNLSFPEVKVEVPGGGSFAVRGLDPDMVVGIYLRHTGELSELWDRFMSDELAQDTAVLAGSLITAAPIVMAELIALASGSKPTDTYVEPDATVNPLGLTDWERDVAAARSLPVPVQVDALMKIAEQTFTSAMPAGKFLAVVIKAAGATTAALTARKN